MKGDTMKNNDVKLFDLIFRDCGCALLIAFWTCFCLIVAFGAYLISLI